MTSNESLGDASEPYEYSPTQIRADEYTQYNKDSDLTGGCPGSFKSSIGAKQGNCKLFVHFVFLASCF